MNPIMNLELLFLACLVSGLVVAWWHWESDVRQFPLEKFDLNDVRYILSKEPATARAAIIKRGSMTRAQWREIVERQARAYEDELQRRNDLG